jgi:hypothetical protein
MTRHAAFKFAVQSSKSTDQDTVLPSWFNAALITHHPFFIWADPISDAVYNVPRSVYGKLNLVGYVAFM